MKYRNKKTVIEGIKFDSKLESKRYQELKILERQGIIKNLQLQPTFELLPTFKKANKTYRKTTYIADFSYWDNEQGKYIVEDVKGFRTDVYKLKKKLFEYKYKDFKITEIYK